MINIGSKQLKGISVGNRAVKAVYKGSQKIWAKESWINLSLSQTYISIPYGGSVSDSGYLVPSGTLEGDGLYGSYEWIVDFEVSWERGTWDSSTMYLQINNEKIYYFDDGSPISSANGAWGHIHKQFVGGYNNLIKVSGYGEYSDITIYRGSESYKSIAWSMWKNSNNNAQILSIRYLSISYKLVNS